MTDVLLAQDDGRLEVQRGRGSFTPDGAAWLLVDRDDVFGTTGQSALVATGDTFALGDDVAWTAVVRRGATVDTRVIAAAEVAVEARGDGPTARTVRTYVSEGRSSAARRSTHPAAGRVGRRIGTSTKRSTCTGSTSRADGFGVQMVYEGDPGEPSIVRDGHVERIRGTYHPVVASPKSSMLYLWALAGESMTLTPEPDPRYT